MANFLRLGLQQAEDKTNLPTADLHFQGPASNQVQVHIGFLVHSISWRKKTIVKNKSNSQI